MTAARMKPARRKVPANPQIQVTQDAEALATPAGFARGVLGHDYWSLQERIADSVAANARTAVKSCHSSSKTFTAADLVLWWIGTQRDGIALTTAPGWLQVEKQLWGEIRTSVQNSRVQFPKPNLTELKIAEGNYAIGISTNESTRFQGFKGKNVLIIVDEAPGLAAVIWEAIGGLMASGRVHVLAIGNPTIVGGEFYDAFTTKRALWNTFTISAFDTPNFEGVSLHYKDESGRDCVAGTGKRDLMDMGPDELDTAARPYLITRRWVRDVITEWGTGHAFFQARVLGEFPTQSTDTLIPLAWLEKVREAVAKPTDRKRKLRAGLDVAGPGEAETVLTVLDDDALIYLKGWPNADPRNEIVGALAPYKDELESLNVDSIGVGWGIYLHLKDEFDVDGKSVVHPVNVGLPARDAKKYANSKAEYFWSLRERIKAGWMSGLSDERLVGQLTAIKYSTNNPKQLIAIESKEDLVKRGIKSPDRAESLMLAQAVAPGFEGFLEFYQKEIDSVPVNVGGLSIQGWRDLNGL